MSHRIIVKQQGRLGNQMFEYAFGRALQLATGSELIFAGANNRLGCFGLPQEINFVSDYSVNFLQRIALHVHTQFTKRNLALGKRHRREYALLPIMKRLGVFVCQDGYIEPPVKSMRGCDFLCLGYFQSEKYFHQYKSLILQDFRFKEDVKDSCKNLASEIQSCESVCVHVRLGDYETIPMYNVTTVEYFINAIDYIRKKINNPHFFLFSNDTKLALSRLNMGDKVTIIPDSMDDQQSLYLGSLCKHHIISNSSYSWWMQYLGLHADQIVIAPSRWFNGDVPCDLYLSNWMTL
ncbi:MAG: alpha-1,2-fucosyltransferase [Bacteroidaceae bacterium]|nr:alpha-1,2-fucosyltransferase [Bacteroidaceae bacterium]